MTWVKVFEDLNVAGSKRGVWSFVSVELTITLVRGEDGPFFVSCSDYGVSRVPLDSEDEDEAKLEALRVVGRKLDQVMAPLRRAYTEAAMIVAHRRNRPALTQLFVGKFDPSPEPCSVCQAVPTVPLTGKCGKCTFKEYLPQSGWPQNFGAKDDEDSGGNAA